MKEIVSTDWLNQNLDNPDLIILDASIAASASGKAFETFDQTIPNARRFDIKNVFSDATSAFPNTVPKPEDFERDCQKLGINQNSKIVVFDTNGVYSSPRAWWLFKVMGHNEVAVLDGGLPNWIDEGHPTVKNHLTEFYEGDFKAQYDENQVVTFEQVGANVKHPDFLVVDARSEGRFKGTAPEPRKHLQSGKIEHSVNIPFQDVLTDGKFKSTEELNAIFQEKCEGEQNLVFSCGSGLTACIVMLASRLGHGPSIKIYDGSWTEWAERNELTLPNS
ncbi:sulfurtransferase [Croceivirga thetidis]|uniref:Sulfurtransferase n=1 Tax=Croceivirga thetidis TaxID=2721623 RepID=A0ABX1GTT8_9FLAO|nr:sulfurtransferase [Croceivirga thetidis]NKI33034.1 sulfurtransferase [Croceivirga thetidis]